VAGFDLTPLFVAHIPRRYDKRSCFALLHPANTRLRAPRVTLRKIFNGAPFFNRGKVECLVRKTWKDQLEEAAPPKRVKRLDPPVVTAPLKITGTRARETRSECVRQFGVRSQSGAGGYISMSGLNSARIFHVMFGWLCLTQNRPSTIGTRITEVRLSAQQVWKSS
jgi:hypothetical protein